MSKLAPVDPEIIAALLCKACPERAEELKAFWQSFEPEFAIKPDGEGVAISARLNKVSWMHKTFAHDWVVTFAGFKSIAPYSPHVCLAVLFGEFTIKSMEADHDLNEAEAELENLLFFARDIRQVDTLENLEWLSDVPVPGFDRELLDTEGQACFDLACLSAAATFLHELRHVQFSVENNAPLGSDAEKECDEFSRKMLLDEVEAYSQSTHDDPIRVKSKRLIGLASAAFSIVICEPVNMAAAITDTHPPLKDRFDHLVMQADVPEYAICWHYLACLLIALLRQRHQLPETVKCSSEKDLCRKLVAFL